MKKMILFVLVGVIALVLGGVVYFNSWAQRPLGPALELQVPAEVQGQAAPVSDFKSKLFYQESTCGISGEMALFLLGVNGPVTIDHEGADSIRLVVVDFDNMEAITLEMPEYFWVDTPGELVAVLGPQAPLNLIYQQALENAAGTPQEAVIEATQILAQVIIDTFEFVPHKYANLSGESFIDLVDELGGVSITLSSSVDGTTENFGFFPAGENQLDGWRTLDFVRVLSPQGERSAVYPDYYGRFLRQNQVILAIFQALMLPENWAKIPSLLNIAQSLIATDLSVGQMRGLSCMVEKVGADAQLLTVGEENIIYDASGRAFPDIEGIKDLIAKMYEPGS